MLTIISLIVIFMLVDPAEVWANLKKTNYSYLGLSALSYLLFLALRAVRWHFLLNNQVSYGQVWHIQNIGYMMNFILPARLGELIRAVLIGNLPPVTVAQGVSTMALERVLDILFMATFLPLTLSQVADLPEMIRQPVLLAGIAGIALFFLLIVAAHQRENAGKISTHLLNKLPFLDTNSWVERLDNLLAGLVVLTNWQSGMILLFWSIILWIPVIFGYYWGMLAVGLDASWLMGGFVMCVAAFAIAAPSSPGQVGIYHAGVIFAINAVLGFANEPATAFAILYHAMNLVFNILLGFIGLQLTHATFGNVIQMARQVAGKRV